MAEYRGESEDAGVGMWLGVPPRSSSEVLIDFISLNLVHWLRNPGSCYLAVVEPGCCCSVAQSCPPLCDPCQASLSITNSLNLLKLMSTESVMPSNHLILYCPLLLPASGSSQMSQFLASGGQSIGVSALASVLPMNIQH